jgi:hypothetical protein
MLAQDEPEMWDSRPFGRVMLPPLENKELWMMVMHPD